MLPTYEEARYKQSIWTILIDYLQPKDEVASAGVCDESRRIFAPRIWSNPVKYFLSGFRTRRLDLSLIPQFLRTHMRTLDLRPFCNEADEDVIAAMISHNIIKYFDNLGVTLVTGFHSHNHEVGHVQNSWNQWSYQPTRFVSGPILGQYGRWPVVLSAVGIQSLEFLGFAPQFSRHHGTIEASRQRVNYIDLSYMQSFDPRSHHITLRDYTHLRVLKLRCVRLDDSQLLFILSGGNFQLWSLDIRDNNLTDKSIEYLVQWTFIPDISRRCTGAEDDVLYEAPPLYDSHHPIMDLYRIPRRRHDDARRFAAELYDGRPFGKTHPVSMDSNGLNIDTGITNLYLSGNKYSIEGVRTLLRKGTTLQVLDIGSVREHFTESCLLRHYTHCISLNSISEYLSAKHAPPIEVLRIHHWIVTKHQTIVSSDEQCITPPEAKLSDRYVAENAFLPSLNHRIRELTLTAMPPVCSRLFLGKITDFLDDARRQEQELASLNRHWRAPPKLSGLRLLRLEFMPEGVRQPSLSVSGDADADAFHQASEGDFSFFEEGREVEEGKVEGKGKEREASAPCSDTADCVDLVESLKEYRSKEPKWRGRLALVFPSIEESQCLTRR